MASPALRLAARWCQRFAVRASDSVLRAKRFASDGTALTRQRARTVKWRRIPSASGIEAEVDGGGS